MISKVLLRQEQFPVTDHLVYFNHAAVGPLSQSTCAAMERHAREQRDFGAYHWRDWYAEYIDFREEAAALINGEPREISILKNTSEGISFVANGLRWKAGDNVVTTDMEFPSNWAPWKRLESRSVECRAIRTENGRFDPVDVENLIDDRTRVVALSFVAFHNGFRPDVETIGTICRDRNVLFCLDAIQGVGAIRTDVKRWNVDFLAADGHKWMMGPEGTAIFFCSERVRDQLDVLESGWMNVDRGAAMIGAGVELLGDGRRFEAGSINTNGVYGLRAAIALLRHIGLEDVEREVLHITGRLGRMLASIGCTVRSPMPPESGIVSIEPPQGVDIERLARLAGAGAERDPLRLWHRWLEVNRIICSARERMLRFSPHFYNDDDDLDEIRAAFDEAMG
ncbi:MAG: aminotransferase class V-fold PLP-dependent enzyme [Thermoanaerobaculia bacterium]